MAIFKHSDGSYRRYPERPIDPTKPAPAKQSDKESDWSQVPGAPAGIQIHKDGKRMRNNAPTDAD